MLQKTGGYNLVGHDKSELNVTYTPIEYKLKHKLLAVCNALRNISHRYFFLKFHPENLLLYSILKWVFWILLYLLHSFLEVIFNLNLI